MLIHVVLFPCFVRSCVRFHQDSSNLWRPQAQQHDMFSVQCFSPDHVKTIVFRVWLSTLSACNTWRVTFWEDISLRKRLQLLEEEDASNRWFLGCQRLGAPMQAYARIGSYWWQAYFFGIELHWILRWDRAQWQKCDHATFINIHILFLFRKPNFWASRSGGFGYWKSVSKHIPFAPEWSHRNDRRCNAAMQWWVLHQPALEASAWHIPDWKGLVFLTQR